MRREIVIVNSYNNAGDPLSPARDAVTSDPIGALPKDVGADVRAATEQPEATLPIPRKIRPRAARFSRERRAASIRDAALAVLAEHGIGHTNHSLVADAAAVSVQTVFFYYRTHAELTALVLAGVQAKLLDGIVRPGATEPRDPRAALEWMLLTFADFIDRERDTARVWLDWSTAIRSETWGGYLAFLAEARRIIAAMLARSLATGEIALAVAPEEAAEVIVGFAHMVGNMKFAGASPTVIARTVQSLVGAILGPHRPKSADR
jgi:TetR/AcrR family hemagglutinin/protease transcriptional regulator